MEESIKDSNRETKIKAGGSTFNINCMNATELNHPSYKL